MKKNWYASKGVIGALLVVVGGAVTIVGKLLTGDYSMVEAVPMLVAAVGAGLGLLGIRSALK